MHHLTATLACVLLIGGCSPRESAGPQIPKTSDVVAAAPGRIEGASETYRIGTSAQGPVQSILVKSGERVTKGQPLIKIACGQLSAEEASLTARVQAARARLDRLRSGARREELDRAEAAVRADTARWQQARSSAERARELHANRKFLSDAALDESLRDESTAKAQLEGSQAALSLLRAGPRPEEVQEAEHDLAALKHSLLSTATLLSYCTVTAPVTGNILRVHVTEGELVSPFNPVTLVSLSDESKTRVRVEVDEKDVAKVTLRQKARVLADALPNQPLTATVEEVSRTMGRKKTLTTDPADKSDRDVLEVLVALDGVAPALPVGLRVTVQFLGR